MKEQKKVKILEKAWEKINEEEKKALDLLEINTWIDWHHTGFNFKKAILDKDFRWELIFDIHNLPQRVKLYYKITLILDPASYNTALKRNFEEMKKNQLSLLEENNKYIEEMEKLHKEYEKDRRILWDYSFDARLSELKNRWINESLNFMVWWEIIRKIESLNSTNWLSKMILVLENL